ncbi:Histidine kinase [Granulicella pectinivorans]|uniref:Histidine kinase n=2 Tax=Granulicella pectinivorans TaxID=474950 RepID=A0A1I6LY24_9BACT|nr:Histidine kinase [Granulicella pectinivorans]
MAGPNLPSTIVGRGNQRARSNNEDGMSTSATAERVSRGWTLLGLAMICWIAVPSFYPLLGQTPLAGMYHRSWTVRDGVPNGINGAVQGKDGFLWFTTDDGLYRFDGVAFERYQPPAGRSLLADRMYLILVAHDGSLWITYASGGVTRIEGDQITNFTEMDGLHSGQHPEMAEDNDGRMWIVGAGGLQYIQDNHVISFVDGNGFGKRAEGSFTVDRDGNLWLPSRSGEGLRVLGRGAKDFIAGFKGMSFDGCDLAAGPGILCWSGMKSIMSFSMSHSTIISHTLMKPSSHPYDAYGTRDGAIWVGTEKDGIQRFTGFSQLASPRSVPKVEMFGRGEGLSDRWAYIVLEDKEGSVWVVTNRGLDQFRSVPFQEVPINYPKITLPASRSLPRLLIGTDRLAEVIQGTVTYLSQKFNLSDAKCVYQADDGTVWVGATRGLWHFQNGQLHAVPLPGSLNGISRNVQTVIEDSSHELWASIGSNGLYRLDKHGWSRRGGLAGLPDTMAQVALRDLRGDLWFGFRKNTLATISSGQVTLFGSSHGLNIGDVRVLAERNGSLWLGGDYGIEVFNHGKFRPFMFSDEQRIRGVSGLVFLSNGDLWINSGSGVFQIAHDEISGWDRNAEYPVKWKLFDYLDGLNGIPGMLSGNPTAAVAADGMLYLTTGSPLQRIDALHIPSNHVAPPVWITTIRTTEGSKSMASNVRLGPATRGLEISYTATSLLIPERVRFRYQLVGYDKDWIDAGTRRQALYPKVPAGTYTFRVVACNNSGLWSPSGASVNLTVEPTWLETIWFKIAVAASLGALLYLGFVLRMRTMKRSLTERLTERFSERERIARDLHDTLFQGVEGGLLHINAVTSRIPMEPAAKDKLNGAFDEVNQVMASARSLIFDQSTPARSLDFEETIVAYGQQVGLLSVSRFSVANLGKKRELQPAVSEEVLKIIKESLSNAFRHANAKQIEVQILYSSNALEICICDDGVGIDPIIMEEGGKRGHWGLSSMRQRAVKIGGQVKVSRRPVGGTEVRIKIPASRAFRSRTVEFLAKLLVRNSNTTGTTA